MSSLRDRLSKGLSIALSDEDEAQAASMKATAPTTGPGQTMTIAALRKQIADLKSQLEARDIGGSDEAQTKIKELEEQLASASMLKLPLERLHEVPGRRRFMEPAKYSELRENLRHNKLVHPVVVRATADGGYEIVSGHHRVDAYRELGRQTIRCVLEDGTEDQADDGAFFANLMQSDLTDYEKYVGLKRFQSKHPELSQTEVSVRVGISQPHVSALLSYERLPTEVHAILQQQMALVGATAASELAAATDAGRGERVTEAVRRLSEKKLDQAQAVRFAKDTDKPKTAKPAATTFKVKDGKSTWCDVRRARNVMRLEFQSEAIAESVQEAIRRHLEALATDAKS
ncbi:ParB, partition protein [Caballeronia terrestris]|jgi:ParB family chromosome partitioning protein|uniref:ParB, partition protein n=1 Tax=Caballeronia terrestris TaxID=1226301 RepID=A0A158KIT5_9BURK|nr:ParB/RepB/Spo0J family partition protein [Caballeronia terrestris]SAL80964.1 ParB, partition protein [Caballeronia terrestris]